MTDADSENSETQVWLDFAVACKYIRKEEIQLLKNQSDEVGKLIYYMINNPEKFGTHSAN